MTAKAACRTCGTEPLENARFCHGCGSPVQDRDTRAEYKQVTVLFDKLAATPTVPGFMYHELPLLRLNAMLAKTRGEEDRYCEFRERYRARAESSGFEGHIALAHAMV